MASKIDHARNELRIKDAIAKGRAPLHVDTDFPRETVTPEERRRMMEEKGDGALVRVLRRSSAEQADYEAFKRKAEGTPYGPASVSKSKPLSANKQATLKAKGRANEALAIREASRVAATKDQLRTKLEREDASRLKIEASTKNGQAAVEKRKERDVRNSSRTK